jgi:hypothetical protein
MSLLTDKLDYILSWLESIKPEAATCSFDVYNPGLTQQQIDEHVESLSFTLSQEVYDLYQWRNGINYNRPNNERGLDAFLFPNQFSRGNVIDFCGLEQSIDCYLLQCEVSQEDAGDGFEYWNDKWFPLASRDGKDILYVIGDIDPSPVYLWQCEFSEPARVYKNLTNLVSVIAECCDNHVYKLYTYQYGEETTWSVSLDEEKLDLERDIYEKYNC